MMAWLTVFVFLVALTLNDIQQNLGTEVGYLDMQAVRWLCPALRPVLSLTRDHVF